MALDLVESQWMTGSYWECPACVTKYYPPRAGEVLEPFCVRGTCRHNICIRCIVGNACPMQLNEAVDTGKSVEVQCPIIFVNGGSRCKGTIVLDGQRSGVRGGRHFIVSLKPTTKWVGEKGREQRIEKDIAKHTEVVVSAWLMVVRWQSSKD